MHPRLTGIVLVITLLLIGGGGAGYVWAEEQQAQQAENEFTASSARRDTLLQSIAAERTLTALVAKAQELGVEAAEAKKSLETLRDHLASSPFSQTPVDTRTVISNLIGALEAKEAELAAAQAEAARYGTLLLVISNGSGAAVTAEQAGHTPVSSTADSTGQISLTLLTGTYTLTITRSGYQTSTIENVAVTSLQTTSQNATLVAIPKVASTPKPQPTATPSVSSSTAHSSYRRETIASSRGSFTADIMQFELGPGKVKVVADTAADGDCSTSCSTLSVAGYASRHPGAIAALHGTYFCPTDYSWCHPNEVNAFFWKIKAPRLGAMINSSNGLGENDGFLTFSSVGNPTYYSRWSDAPAGVYTGINHKPTVVKNGAYNVVESELDDKQRTSKITRAALGVKGNTAYAVIVTSATVMDLGAVMEALGVDTALNLDGGGSAAMWYNGSYKRGPGRSVPNALIFIEQ